MKCNLVKKVQKKVVEGKERYFTHYQLHFENGKVVRICAEYIDNSKIKDSEKKEGIKRSNYANAISLDSLADLLEE